MINTKQFSSLQQKVIKISRTFFIFPVLILIQVGFRIRKQAEKKMRQMYFSPLEDMKFPAEKKLEELALDIPALL